MSATAPVVSWQVYSSDDHLDMWALPRDVWSSRVPAALADQCPHVVEIDGRPWWVAGERRLSPSGEGGRTTSAIKRVGETDDETRVSTPSLRLKDMDRDGVYASVIFGPIVGAAGVEGDGARRAFYTAWNQYAAEFNRADPDRLAVLAALPQESSEDAAAELYAAAELGLRGATISPFMFDYRQPEWDRLWAAAADTGLPIHFHLGGGTSRLNGAAKGWEWAAHRAVVPMQLDESLSAMVMSGALERNPGMTLVMTESGAGWLPYLVNRMDEAVENRAHMLKEQGFSLKQKPSEIFRQQVMISFEQEPNAAVLLPLVGTDRFMWGSDYPHLDSTWPNSREAIQTSLGDLPEADRRLVTADNCRRVYRFS